jgi:hypothetical protein
MPATCPCERCGRLCKVADSSNPDARLLRHSTVPKGVCANCGATIFLKATEPCGMLIERNGPECLRHEHIQEQFAAIMRVGMADAKPDELDWAYIIANWGLPIKQAKGNRKRPKRSDQDELF